MKIFNSSTVSNQPIAFAKLLHPISLVDWTHFWPGVPIGNLPQALPAEADVRAAVRNLPAGLVAADIEHYPAGAGNTDQELAQSNDWYVQITQWMRDERTDLKFGWYNIPGVSYGLRYPAEQDANSGTYQEFRKVTEAFRGIGYISDWLGPSYYMHFNKDTQAQFPNAVQDFCKLNIAELRRLHGPKPIYPFIWAVYHEAAQPLELRGTYATDADWMFWIENTNMWADAMIYWGSMDPGPWQDATIQRLMETGP